MKGTYLFFSVLLGVFACFTLFMPKSCFFFLDMFVNSVLHLLCIKLHCIGLSHFFFTEIQQSLVKELYSDSSVFVKSLVDCLNRKYSKFSAC